MVLATISGKPLKFKKMQNAGGRGGIVVIP